MDSEDGEIQSMIDRLTSCNGTVTITQYPRGFVDVMASFDNGLVLVTERFVHESIDAALADIQKQYEEIDDMARSLKGRL